MKCPELVMNRRRSLALVLLPLLLQAAVGVACIRHAFGSGTDHRGYPALTNESLGVAGYFILVTTGVLGVVWIALPRGSRWVAPILNIGSLVLTTGFALAVL
jgi:hypothetical protein